jgi:AcrR family transcriptional regulator
MPKLSPQVMEKKKGSIERAAQALFIKQGYHATSMRDIASRADVSLGNLYNYYATKEDLLKSITEKYQEVINERLRAMFSEFNEPFLPENLLKFGQRVKQIVNEHSDYWLLMYIDVLEFENRHFRKMFENLTSNLRKQFAAHFNDLKRKGVVRENIDPAVGFTAVYMQFFNYFLVEKLFGGNRHFGMTDDQVIAKLTDIFCRGILQPEASKRRANGKGSKVAARSARKGKAALK